MRMQAWLKVSVLTVGLLAGRVGAQGTAFAYQGMLQDAGAPANGSYDIRFTLYGDESYGSPLAAVVVMEDLLISNGLFATTLDFGAGLFDGSGRWVEVAVRPGDSSGDFTALTPRQAVQPVPYAIFAAGANGAGLTGTIPATSLPTNSVDATILSTNIGVWTRGEGTISYLDGNVGIGTLAPEFALDVAGTVRAFAFVGDGSGLTNLNPIVVSNALAAAANIPANKSETVNPMQAALMKWYVGTSVEVPVGAGAGAMVFDGTSLWVANSAGNSVTKFNPREAVVEGTFPVGNRPGSLTYDGKYIWVVNDVDNTVTKLVAQDGTYANGTLASSTSWVDWAARGIVCDGTHIWILNNGCDGGGIIRLRTSDGQPEPGEGTQWLGGGEPVCLTFDGQHVWIAAKYIWNGSELFDGLIKLRASDGQIVGLHPASRNPNSVVYDGACIWTSSASDASVTRVRASDGAILGTYAVGNNPGRMSFDGNHIWVVNQDDGTVTRIHTADGTYENGTLDNSTYSAGTMPTGIAFDGTSIWIADASLGLVRKL